jgi:putative permease
MIQVLKQWFARYFSDPQAVSFIFLLGFCLVLILSMGHVLAPVIASIIIAYLLQWVANVLCSSCKLPRTIVIYSVYIAFLGVFLGLVLIFIPTIGQQTARLAEEMPNMISKLQHLLYLLPEKFPEFVNKEMVDSWVSGFSGEVRPMGKRLLTASIASIPTIISLIIYLILVPLMVFFFLKDNHKIIGWLARFLPGKRPWLHDLWLNMDEQIGNYVRGKVAEIIIVGLSTYIVFVFFEMQYAALLAALVGLSVIIPYVGAAVVTIPVVLVALFQWGLTSQAAYALIGYSVIQVIDGNILVPLLFSEAVNLHPVAIIIAILIFGGIWGFWGVFFAIPLATLVKSIVETWPSIEDQA